MKNLYIATIGEDFACWVKKTQSGLELDQFCMAENLDEPKIRIMLQRDPPAFYGLQSLSEARGAPRAV